MRPLVRAVPDPIPPIPRRIPQPIRRPIRLGHRRHLPIPPLRQHQMHPLARPQPKRDHRPLAPHRDRPATRHPNPVVPGLEQHRPIRLRHRRAVEPPIIERRPHHEPPRHLPLDTFQQPDHPALRIPIRPLRRQRQRRTNRHEIDQPRHPARPGEPHLDDVRIRQITPRNLDRLVERHRTSPTLLVVEQSQEQRRAIVPRPA